MKSDYIVVLTTADNPKLARQLADELVEQRLAACTQISSPIKSAYRWEGKIQHEQEWQIFAKCRSEQWEAVCALIKKLHSYSVPEIIALPITAGHPDYLKWIDDETRQ